MSTTTTLKHARSRIVTDNIQELLDAEKGNESSSLNGNAQQYTTPKWLAEASQAKLPKAQPDTILDPQVGEGDTVKTGGWYTSRYGADIDNRLSPGCDIKLIIGNCVKVFETVDELFPDLKWECANANPPFGKRWKQADDSVVDSTQWTWDMVTKRANYGYLISNHNTLVKLGIKDHPWVFDYTQHDGTSLWKGMRDTLKIGVACWKNPAPRPADNCYVINDAWEAVSKVIDQEKVDRPKFNIYLDRSGYLRTYLSVRSELKLKLDRNQILRLHRINECHPLALTTEKESRDLLRELVDAGYYVIEPAAKTAIESALADVKSISCPIMPVTPFETVAYADEEDALMCINDVSTPNMRFSKGQRYPLQTGTYKYTDKFKTTKIHFSEDTLTQYAAQHDCISSGTDRYITFTDDSGKVKRFMDRPVHKDEGMDHDEEELWKVFEKPVVKTIAEMHPKLIEQNLAVLRSLEMIAGYEYYPGQRAYLARVACKDAALVAGATGTGKTLMAISLLAAKGPARALIVAPGGTMRSSSSEDEDDGEEGAEDMNASQWIKEINRFAPHLQIWELFSVEDYERVCSLNKGKLPPGVYVTYYEALFVNKAKEKTPDSWDDTKLAKFLKTQFAINLPEAPEGTGPKYWCDSVGREMKGTRSIITPCLATRIGDLFDFVLLDEAHKCVNLNALVTQMMVRLQPRYRYACTATPIPNIVSNLFSLMGWLAVPGWYRGGIRNAAWPYAREELGRFDDTFLSIERDMTQENMRRKADKYWRGKCEKKSPVISSPARLLKLLKPTMAYISKENCNPDYRPPKIVDVRVPFGADQAKLYGYYLNRANVPGGHPLIRARRQTAWLRNICADPAGFHHGTPSTPHVTSNMNPKVICILELVRDMIAEGEQVVIINSRVGLTDAIQHRLAEAGVPIARIDSTISPDNHAYQANMFKAKRAPVMLLGLKCAASHSFDKCKYAIIGSLEYSNGPFDQAKGRVDRVVSRPGVTIYCVLHQDSIEEVQFQTVATKDDAATICLKGCRIPRGYKPVTGDEVLASAIDKFSVINSTPEADCEAKWPAFRDALKEALATYNLTSHHHYPTVRVT